MDSAATPLGPAPSIILLVKTASAGFFPSPVSRYEAELPNLNPGCEHDEPPGERNNKNLHHLLLAFRLRSRSAPTPWEQCPEGGARRQKGDGIIHQSINHQINVKRHVWD